MSAKTYQRILQYGLFLSLGVIFLVFGSLLFPYISSKQLTFNILMELMFPFWLLLVWKYPDFRPLRSRITYGLIVYLAVILISAFTGVDFNLSFWGDTERMLGFFHVLHFFLFYLYLITAFRDKKDWNWFFILSVLLATIQAIIVVGFNKIGTIGNTAYVSGYFIFNIYFALILVFKYNWRIHWPLYPTIVLMLVAFLKANTSGAIIGLSASLMLLLLLLGIFAAKKQVRRLSLSILIVALAGIILLFSQYNQPWFKENQALRNLSFHKATFQTRRLSWEGAAKDFHLHPWLGTGFGNYAIIFDRQFDPDFFNYATSETYFDRAHNNIIDIISTTGILGLLAYLSIFIFLIIEWLQALKREAWRIRPGREGARVRELMLIAVLIFAYFVQNLAVFDSLATYMGLMAILAYFIFFRNYNPEFEPGERDERLSAGKELGILVTTIVLVLIIVSSFNIRPYKMMTKTIKAYQLLSSTEMDDAFESFHQAFIPSTVLDRDSRSILINFVINNPTLMIRGLSAGKMETALDYAMSLVDRNLEYNPADSLTLMQAAQLYDISSRYYYQDSDKFKEYSDKAISFAQKAVDASPRRIPAFFVLGQIQANAGYLDEAENTFLAAHELNPNYVETSCQLANYYYLVKDSRYSDYSGVCLKDASVNLVPDLLTDIINNTSFEDDPELLLLAHRALATKGIEEPLLYINLAKLELWAGNFDAAMKAAEVAGNLDETLKPEIEQFLKEIESAQIEKQ